MRIAFVVLVVLAACSSSGGEDDGDESDDAACEIGALVGEWSVFYEELEGGTCGELGAELANLTDPDVQLPDDCTRLESTIADDACASQAEHECVVDEFGTTVHWVVTLEQPEPDLIEGLATTTVVDPREPDNGCESSYSLRLERTTP